MCEFIFLFENNLYPVTFRDFLRMRYTCTLPELKMIIEQIMQWPDRMKQLAIGLPTLYLS